MVEPDRDATPAVFRVVVEREIESPQIPTPAHTVGEFREFQDLSEGGREYGRMHAPKIAALLCELGGSMAQVAREKPDPQTSQMHTPASTHLRVLLVEDEPVIGPLLRTLLGARGHAVDVAVSAKAALTAITTTPDGYDVVVLDQHLPDMLGSDVAHRLRNLAPDLPLVLATGDLGAVTDTAPFNVLLEKPFSGQRLESAVLAAFSAPVRAA